MVTGSGEDVDDGGVGEEGGGGEGVKEDESEEGVGEARVVADSKQDFRDLFRGEAATGAAA